MATVHLVLAELLDEDELVYVVGAFSERRQRAADDGRAYCFEDFLREALLNASHRDHR